MMEINLITQKNEMNHFQLPKKITFVTPLLCFGGEGLNLMIFYHPSGMANLKIFPPNFVGD
jgi:hypothetical protein